MAEPKTSIEIISPSIEEAVARGAGELGVPEDAVEVEVLDEGSKGFLGLGNRQARVRLTIRDDFQGQPAVMDRAAEVDSEIEEDDALVVTKETVDELLQRMGIQADIKAYWGEMDETSRFLPLHVDIHGSDLSILIGRRGETLSALQYITRLIVGKELKRPIAVVVDVEGYRLRREQQLRQLARRMAQQAIDRGKTMSLEPMPPNERRLIHLELRDHPEVYTESVGERDRRKVTIIIRS